MIYLDNAATTKPLDRVVSVVEQSLKNEWYNPSALYSNAQTVHRGLSVACQIIADSIHASPEEIYFTSGGSESNNWVLQGFIRQALLDNVTPIIVTTQIEHKSIMLCCKYLQQTGIEVHYVGVDDYGMVDIGKLEDILVKISINHKTNFRILVSIQHANNEIGTIQEIAHIADLVHRHNALFHTDAVQTYGKVLFDTEGADFISVSGHKVGATKGIGFLYINHNATHMIQPLIYGTQNRFMRGGTENVSAILGLASAVNWVEDDCLRKQSIIQSRRIFFASLLRKNCDCVINGSPLDNRQLGNIISITLNDNVTGEALIYLLNTKGFEIAAGSACNSHTNEPSYVLKAIGKSDSEAMRTIRISFDKDLTIEQMQLFCKELKKAIDLLIS